MCTHNEHEHHTIHYNLLYIIQRNTERKKTRAHTHEQQQQQQKIEEINSSGSRSTQTTAKIENGMERTNIQKLIIQIESE